MKSQVTAQKKTLQNGNRDFIEVRRHFYEIMNDILRPELIWIEGRCYRVNDPIMEVSTLQEHDIYENDAPFNELEEEDIDDVGCEVIQVDGNRFCTTLHVSKHYMGSIIGKKGATIARIGRDTRTDIKTPRHGENKDVTIYGSSVSNVKAAVRRINIIVMSARMKQAYTHFISIPMNSPEIVKNFEIFKESVLRECPDIEECLFIKPGKLHITVGVMCLMDNEERLLASQLLTEAKDKYIMPILRDHSPLKIRLKGLSYMNDEPSAVHVLYGRVHEHGAPAGLLQRVVDALHGHFYRAGTSDFVNLPGAGARARIPDNLPLKIRLKGLSYMNDEPSAVHVLYGRVQEDGAPAGLLQRVVDALHGHFYRAGFMEKEFNRDNIKMHVTLLNSKYRAKQKQLDNANGYPDNSRIRRETFDGSGILSKFADYDFGVTEFETVHLSQRSTVGPDGYYQPTCVVSCISTK